MVSAKLRPSWAFVLLGLIHSMLGTHSLVGARSGGDGFPLSEVPVLQSTTQSARTSAVEAEFADLRDLITQHGSQTDRREYEETVAHQALRRESLILASDRDPVDIVLRRNEALLTHIETMLGAPDLSAQKAKLSQLKMRNTAATVGDTETRYELFDTTLRVRRTIAFSNPLLDFDRILFIKRQFLPETKTWGPDMLGNHMCDQYFGFHAIPGGGLFVLEDAFSEQPRIRDVLADSVVLNGRFRGKRLNLGGFLSPELSFNGKSILFAYTEAEPTRYEWTEKSTFHIFKVNVDGSGLVQLTDGPVNDFDPCWLPDGRIIFISERRGGYGRCHPRPVPLYTLHSMNADGTDIVRISHHEANEWQPSVDHNGMVLYTRWDYVDRGNIQAHHPWITTPDGLDARAIQGNYGRSKGARPTMEMDVRAIPGSHRYVATAAAHHSQAYGSLVLIDPHTEDDDAMGSVRRITPEVPFPEAETNYREGQVYASAWPLNELFYLCVYDPEGAARRGTKNNYGIYLVDAFGNKDLIYRDLDLSCLSPIPLKPREKPHAVPPLTSTVEETVSGGRPTSLIGVVNVYESLKPFPEGTKITAIRIIQVLPKTTPLIDEPKISFGSEKGARAVLGTVPVESDGSAYFSLPAGVPVYFQVLNERGLAIQSMRSDTYAHPGEKLLCRGCHEPRHVAPAISQGVPLAFRRPPSAIRPDVDGSNPFSFPRLVQPVLDRNCVICHNKESEAPDLRKGEWEEQHGYWYTSYRNLREYAFFYGVFHTKYDPWTDPRTTPGQFGARASRLHSILTQGHYDVRLSKKDLHRVNLWLDCNSDFFGSYEDPDVQAAGRIAQPTLH